MSGAARYLAWVDTLMQRLQREQLESIQRAGKLVADVLRADRLIYMFGTRHSRMLAKESLCRAGGLAPVTRSWSRG